VAISIPPAWAEDTARYLGVQRAEISVMVHRDGSISDAALTVPSGTPAMDSILRVALAAMDSASKDRRAAAQSDSMRVSIIVGTDRWGSSAFAVAVMTVAIATLRPTQFVDVLPGQKLPHPKGSPQTGSVMAMFAVGRDGRAVPGSIRIIRASAKNLGEAATNVIPTWRFSPAEYDGCPIVWWVEQPFEFR
jgi:outer membrane biosynthesis protein TonB